MCADVEVVHTPQVKHWGREDNEDERNWSVTYTAQDIHLVLSKTQSFVRIAVLSSFT